MGRKWNVEVEDTYSRLAGRKPEPVPEGGTVHVSRFYIREDGDRFLGGVLFQCPRCGSAGSCPVSDAVKPGETSWDISGLDEGRVTMFPSILCTMPTGPGATGPPCGGHYWLTNGVLTEV